MKKPNSTLKLPLATETIRSLDHARLDQAAGGRVNVSTRASCDGRGCDPAL